MADHPDDSAPRLLVASRTLQDNAGHDWRVEIFAPTRVGPNGEDYICEVQLIDPLGRISWNPRVAGIDSVHSLTLALILIGDVLSNNSDGLVFLGEPSLGFPSTTARTADEWVAEVRFHIHESTES